MEYNADHKWETWELRINNNWTFSICNNIVLYGCFTAIIVFTKKIIKCAQFNYDTTYILKKKKKKKLD